jgi:hypothetical protein
MPLTLSHLRPFFHGRRTSGAPRVERLASLPLKQLEALYRGGKVPELNALQGDLQGRVLDTPLLGVFSKKTTLLIPPEISLWHGKTFDAPVGAQGEGRNRMATGKMFPFKYFVGPSRTGMGEAIHLDYSRSGNIPGISNIQDEIREVAPGLFLGQVYLTKNAEKKGKLVLYFALERA